MVPQVFCLGFPRGTSGKEPTCQCRKCKKWGFYPWVGKIPWRRALQLTAVFLPGESYGWRSLAGYCPQSWKSWTQLKWLSIHELTSFCHLPNTWVFSKFTIINLAYLLLGTFRLFPEKAMAPHSSTLAWKIPWMEEPWRAAVHGVTRSRTQLTLLSLFTFMHWRRKWQPTPVFLPGESQGRGSLMGCHLRGHTESDPTKAT